MCLAAVSIPGTGGEGEIVSGFAVRQGFNDILALATDGWPSVGGFAVENLGQAQINVAGSSTWPSLVTTTVHGVRGVTYSRSDGFTATGGPFTFPEASVIDVDLQISTIQDNTTITINATRNSVDEWQGTLVGPGVGRTVLRLTKQNTGDYALPNNDSLAMLLSADNSGLTYDVIAVRWSLTADEYRHIGSTAASSGTGGYPTINPPNLSLIHI